RSNPQHAVAIFVERPHHRHRLTIGTVDRREPPVLVPREAAAPPEPESARRRADDDPNTAAGETVGAGEADGLAVLQPDDPQIGAEPHGTGRILVDGIHDWIG